MKPNLKRRKYLKQFIKEQQPKRPPFDEVKDLWNEVISQCGYLVIATKPGFDTLKLGETITTLWEYRVGQPFRVIAFTDQKEYDAHIDIMRCLRPAWPRMAKASYFGDGGKFYRVTTD